MSHGPFCACCGCQLWIIREPDGRPATYCRKCKRDLALADCWEERRRILKEGKAA